MAAYDIPCPPTRDYRCLISEECDVAMEAVLDKHARKGIINFLGDMKISYTTTQLATSFLRASFRRPWNVYQYVLDQPGPFQSGLPAVIEGRAYHTVDLLLLFQGYDLKDGHRNPLEVGLCMQDCWATFAHGQGEPWVGSNEIFAFGPGDDWAGPIEMTRSDGSGEVELGRRRNLVAWKVLNEIGWDALRPVVDAVARRIIIDGLFRVWID